MRDAHVADTEVSAAIRGCLVPFGDMAITDLPRKRFSWPKVYAYTDHAKAAEVRSAGSLRLDTRREDQDS